MRNFLIYGDELYLDAYFITDTVRNCFTLPIFYRVLKEGEIKAEGIQLKFKKEEVQGLCREYRERKGRIEDLLKTQTYFSVSIDISVN